MLTKAKSKTDETQEEDTGPKPEFSCAVKFGGPSFGVETAGIGITIADANIPERRRHLFIQRQLLIRLSTDPNPPQQRMLEGMEDPYEYREGICKCNRISVGESEVTARLKFSRNAIDPMFLVGLAGTTGSIQVMKVMEIDHQIDNDSADEDE